VHFELKINRFSLKMSDIFNINRSVRF